MIIKAVEDALKSYFKNFKRYLWFNNALCIPLFIILAAYMTTIFGGVDNSLKVLDFFRHGMWQNQPPPASLVHSPTAAIDPSSFVITVLAFVLLMLAITLFMTVGNIVIADDIFHQRERTVLDTLKRSAARVGPVFLIMLITMLIMMAGMSVLMIIGFLLAMIHPVLMILSFFGMILLYLFQFYIMVKVSMALPVCIVEGRGPLDSLKQSFQMTRQHFWKLLLCFFVTYVGIGMVATPLFLLFFLAVFLPAVPGALLCYVAILGYTLLLFILYVIVYHVYTALRVPGDGLEGDAGVPPGTDNHSMVL